MSHPTTRRHPRSLAQAYPREHANPIEFYPAGFVRRYWRAAVCIAALITIGATLALGV